MKYHLIGSEGVSMRGIGKYLEFLGNEVSGSDIKTGGHKAENIDSNTNIVVRTSAVSPGSPGWCEVEAAQAKGIEVVKRSALIGKLFNDKRLIAISGMHGKTTVTAMAGLTLIEANFDPTVLVGDGVKEFGGDVIKIGNSEWVVFEACEYDRSFLDFYPEILILTNIEEEHLDTYPGGISEIKEAFSEYVSHVKEDGVIIACVDDTNVKEVIKNCPDNIKVIEYGFSSENYNHLPFELGVPGKHNQLNALAVLALVDHLKIDRAVCEKALKNFSGAKRRFEKLGEYNWADLIDDYGHHPTEIKTTIDALCERYPDKRKTVVFWPHQYKRIKPLVNEFAEAFEKADLTILKPIFFVPGRDEVLDVSSEDIVLKIKNAGHEAMVMNEDAEIAQYLKANLNNDDVVLTIGIPPVYKVIEKILE